MSIEAARLPEAEHRAPMYRSPVECGSVDGGGQDRRAPSGVGGGVHQSLERQQAGQELHGRPLVTVGRPTRGGPRRQHAVDVQPVDFGRGLPPGVLDEGREGQGEVVAGLPRRLAVRDEPPVEAALRWRETGMVGRRLEGLVPVEAPCPATLYHWIRVCTVCRVVNLFVQALTFPCSSLFIGI